jgi:hypothetical protein
MAGRWHGVLGTAAIALPLIVLACAEGPSGQTVPPCDPSGSTTYLRSKLDDDDGDGNPADEQFPDINDEDDDIADHAWVRGPDGRYHLFFQNEGHGGGSDIEHYVSTDLQSLDYVGVALRRSAGGWDRSALWAPHVVAHDGTYWMFYTGTTGTSTPDHEERIGLARSTDLVQWTRVAVNRCPGTTGDGCVYDCNEDWTTAGRPPVDYNRQCRDPFVVWDAAARRWVLFATAKSTNGFAVVTVAYASDLEGWRGAGYVDATRLLASGTGAQTTGGQAENPAVVTHAGTHYLLFTDWHDPEDRCTAPDPRTQVQYATSPTLGADPQGSLHWTYRGYTPDPGVNAIEVQVVAGDIAIMSQSISNPNSCVESAHRRELRLKRIEWGAGTEFSTLNASKPLCRECRPCDPVEDRE